LLFQEATYERTCYLKHANTIKFSMHLTPSILAVALMLPWVIRISGADTFSYDASGAMAATEGSNGLGGSFGYDEAGNIEAASVTSADFEEGGGTGNGLPDWWELFYFGERGIDAGGRDIDGVAFLTKFALGISPGSSSEGLLPQAEFDGEDLSFVFGRSRYAENIDFLVQSSEDLTDWEDLTTATAVALAGTPLRFSEDGQVAFYEARVPVGADRLFLRLHLVSQ
jgi:hypothetical protein